MHRVRDLPDVGDHHEVEEELEPVHSSAGTTARGCIGRKARPNGAPLAPRGEVDPATRRSTGFPSALLLSASNSPWLMVPASSSAFAFAMSSAGLDEADGR